MAQYELNFSDYWRIIQKRKFIIIFSTIVVTSFSFLFTLFQPKIYQASTTVKIEENQTVAGLLLESLVPTYGRGDMLETESNVITSWPVCELAAKKLGFINQQTSKDDAYSIVANLQNSVSTEVVKDTNLIKIIVTAKKPQQAADLANAVTEAYVEENYKARNIQAKKIREFIEEQLKVVGDNLKASEDALRKFKTEGDITGVAVRTQDRLLDLKSKISEALKKYTDKHPFVISLQGQIKDVEKELENLPPREVAFARLEREKDLNEKSYAVLREKLEEARITEASKIGNASIVDVAVPAREPLRPMGSTPIFLGAILGVVLGFVMSFVMESTDTSIGAIEDVEAFLKLPVLGVIPNIKLDEEKEKTWQEKLLQYPTFFKKEKKEKLEKKKDTGIPLVAHYAPKSPVAEAYRILRTNIKFSKERKMILFTSALHQEGKSTIGINLALTAAQLGSRTLLLSCDMRRSVLSKTFGLRKDRGISDVLTGTLQLEEVVQGMTNILMGNLGWDDVLRTPGIDNLYIITSGRYLMNPAELLSSEQMKLFLKRVREMFDLIIIDSPPVLPVTDALILAPLVDTVVLVYQVGRVARGSLLRAKAQLEGVGANILGVVLNHVRPETERADTEYYHHRYYGKEEKEH